MEMISARRRGKRKDQIILWGICLLLSSLSLVLVIVSSGFGAVKIGGDGLLVRSTDVEGNENTCDDHRMFFDGQWVRDERYPLYESRHCPFVDEGLRCGENGRPDQTYTKWRWQPKHCNLPRFDAKKLLEILRNRRLVFAGDSIGRNQWESLLCMLSSVVADKSSIYEENGNPITKHKGFLSFKFRDYNCTVEHYRAPYLIRRAHPPRGSPKYVNWTLRLDVMDLRSPLWKDADILVFNTGHWWNHERLLAGGCYFQEGKKLRMKMGVESAYQRATKTLHNWIEKEVNASKTLVVFRTYSPAHVRTANGDCGLETLPELNSSKISLKQWPGMLNPAFEQSSLQISTMPKLEVLNITLMTAQRKDGHPSIYNVVPLSSTAAQRRDCSHWCLPGVPDVWNELLYALILKEVS